MSEEIIGRHLGNQSGDISHLLLAVKQCRDYIKYLGAEGLFPDPIDAERMADAVAIGEESLAGLKGVMLRFGLTHLVVDDREHHSYAIILFFWPFEEFLVLRGHSLVPEHWQGLTKTYSVKLVVACHLLAFFGNRQSRSYETRLSDIAYQELREKRSVPKRGETPGECIGGE